MIGKAIAGVLGLAPLELARAHTATPAFNPWTFDPLVVVSLLLLAAVYAWRVGRLWRDRGSGRDIRRWQVVCFGIGVAALFLALAGPIDALASVTFSGHMIQHALLMSVAAPLLALGAPLIGDATRSQRGVVFGKGTVLTRPFTAFLLHGLTIWFWHAPGPYEAALGSTPLHILEHGTFLFTALLFWQSLIRSGRDPAFGYGAGAFWCLATVVHTGMLGALLTFAKSPLYPTYQDLASPFMLSPLQDQQLAGLIMWIPTSLIYLIAGLLSVGAWVRSVESV